MTYLGRNAATGLVFVVVMLGLELLGEQLGLEHLWGFVYKVGLAAYFCLSLLINRGLLRRGGSVVVRYVLFLAVCCIATLTVGYLTLVAVVNLHLWRGRSL